MKRAILGCVILPAAVLAAVFLFSIQSASHAGHTAPGYTEAIPQPVKRGMTECAAATERTLEEMEAADMELAAAGQEPVREPQRAEPYLTPLGPVGYKALKEQLAASAAVAKPETAVLLTAPSILEKFEGVNQVEAGNAKPPDTQAAPGISHVVEVTNRHVDIYSRSSSPRTRKQFTLASFFGYGYPQRIIGPRVLYDHVWKRFVVIAANLPPAADPVTLLFIAVSKGSNPTQGWWIFSLNLNGSGTTLWDFPMLGMDQDAVIITGNLFNYTPGGAAGTYISSDCISIPKARVYNGGAFATVWWTGLHWSPQPPVVLPPAAPVLMKNATHLVSADPYSDNTKIYIHTLKDSAYPATQTLTSSAITVAAWEIPPDAPQPGTTAKLDTLDGRFANNSTQIFDHNDGGSDQIFQVHTVKYGTYAMPTFYRLKIPTLSVAESGKFWAGDNSQDFNASIAANNNKDMFVTWSSTDPGAGKNAQIRVSGKKAGETNISAGKLVAQSTTYYTAGRWGNHSSTHIDHNSVDMKKAWICNQYIRSDRKWGTKLGLVELP